MADPTYFSPETLAEMQRLRDLRSYGESEAGQQAADAELKNLDYYQIAANGGDARDLQYMGEIEQMLRTGDFAGLRARLGDEKASSIISQYAAEGDKARQDRESTRSWLRAAGDTAIVPFDTLGGAVMGLSTIAAQVAPGLDGTPLQTGERLQEYHDAYQQVYSDTVNAHERYKAAREAGKERESRGIWEDSRSVIANKANPDQLDGRTLVGGILTNQRYNWANAIESVKDTVSDPVLAAQGLVAGITSMGEAIAAKGTLEAVGRVALKQAVRRVEAKALALETEKILLPELAGQTMQGAHEAAQIAAQQAAVKAAMKFASGLEHASVAGATGITEGLSAYDQTLTEVMRMDPLELYKTSEPMKQRVSELTNGHPESASYAIFRQAQSDIAQRAAFMAGGGNAITSTAIGALLPEGLQDPTHVVSKGRTMLGAFGKDVLKETLEEGLQSGYGQLAQNIAKQQFVNPNQDLSEGIASQVGAGAALGGLTAGALKGPHAVTGTASLGAEGVKLLSDIGANRKIARVEAAGSASAQSLTEQTRQIYNDKALEQSFVENARTTLDETQASLEERVAAGSAITELLKAPRVSELPKAVEQLDPETKKKFTKGMFRVTAAEEAAKAFNSATNSDSKEILASVLLDVMDPVNQHSQTPTALKSLEQNPKIKEAMTKYQEILGNISKLPEVQKAIAGINEFVQKNEVKDPKLLVVKAQQDPALTDTKLTSEKLQEKINLASSKDSKNPLTEAQRKILEGSVAILRAREEVMKQNLDKDPEFYNKLMDAHLDGDRTLESVAHQATIQGDTAYNENKKFSVKQHMGRIIGLVSQGQTALAKAYLERLGFFSESHSNKIEALNRSFENGGTPQTYQQYIPNKNKFMDSGSNPDSLRPEVFLNEGPKSQAFARQVDFEAQLITQAHNELAKAFPELGVKEMGRAELNPQVSKKSSPAATETVQTPAPVETAPAAPKETKTESKLTETKQQETTPAKTEETKPAQKESESTPKLESKPAPTETKVEEAPAPKAPLADVTKPVETPAAAPAPAKKAAPTFVDWTKNLVKMVGSSISRFASTFTENKDGTRLTGEDSPRREVAAALSSTEAFDAHVDSKNAGRWTAELANEYRTLLSSNSKDGRDMGHVLGQLNAQLQEFLDSEWGKGVTFEQAIREGKLDTTVMMRGKATAIIELDPKTNKLVYNQDLIQRAVLAGLQWQISNSLSPNTINLDEEEVLDKLGITSSGEALDASILARMQAGLGTQEAKRSLSRLITEFWGVKGKSDVGMGFTEGVPEAVAAEIMRAMVATNLLRKDPIDLSKYNLQSKEFKTLDRYVPTRWAEDSQFRAYSTVLEDLVLNGHEGRTFYGDDKVPVRDVQRRNSQIELTKEQKTSIRNMQSQQFFLHMPMVKMLTEMSEEAFLSLFGYNLGSEGQYNINDYKAMKGKNASLTGARDQLITLVAEMQNVAKARKVSDISELGKKFQYAIGSNNRAIMQGSYNPQISKLMREVLLATWSNLDLSPDSKHQQFFYLAVAQALGEKIHRQTLAQNVKWTRDGLAPDGKLTPIVDLIAKHLKDGGEFPAAAYKAALDTAKIESTPLSLMALTELARVKNATPAELKSFRTPLYLESDGMTNGPFNTMGLLTTSRFTLDWLTHVRRGGVQFGSVPTTADTLLQGGDIYKAAMVVAQDKIQAHLAGISARASNDHGPVIHSVANQLFTALQEFFPKDVKNWDPNKLTVTLDRGIGKNPMTQMVYGAGPTGLSNGITHRMLDEFYGTLSELVQNPELVEKKSQQLLAMAVLASVKVSIDKETGAMYVTREGTVKALLARMEKPAEFAFSSQEKQTIAENMTNLFVLPMREGITQVLGESVMESGQTLAKVTQFQTMVARSIYGAGIHKALTEKIANYVKNGMPEAKAKGLANSEFLSKDELSKIWEETVGTMPIVDSDGQRFLISKKDSLIFWESAKEKGGARFEYSKSLDDLTATKPDLKGVANPGVAAIPYLTIGMGDARMVRELYQRPFDNTMQVYDGINIPIDRITEYGSRINEAALKAWQANVFESVSKTFAAFQQNEKVKASLYDPTLVADVLSTMKLGFDERGKKVRTLSKAMEMMALELKNAQVNAQARRVALSQIALSMDQMAGTYNPFVSKGIDVAGLEDQQIVDLLNTYARDAAKRILAGEDVQPEGRVADPQQKLLTFEEEPKALPAPAEEQKALPVPVTTEESNKPLTAESPVPQQTFLGGKIHDGSGATFIRATALQDLTKILKPVLDKSELLLLNNLLKSPLMKGVSVVTGTLAQVQEFQRLEGRSSLANYQNDNPTAEVKGLYSPGEKTIYLMDPTIETLVHELVHASTYQTVLAYYNGDKEVRQGPAGEAIRGLSDLMDKFLKGGTHGLDQESPVYKALVQAQREINNYRPWDLHNQTPAQKAAALNEFMAWTLANKDLVQSLGSKEEGALGTSLGHIVGRAWDAIKKLIWRGRRAAPGAADGRLVSNRIRIYTSVVARNPSLQATLSEVALAHSTITGNPNDRLSSIIEAFGTQIARHLGEVYNPNWYANAVNTLQTNQTTAIAFLRADEMLGKALKAFDGGKFTMSPIQQSAFRMMVMAMATEARLNAQSLTEASNLYNRFLQVAEVKDFLPDPNNFTQAEEHAAQEMLKFLTTGQMNSTDQFDRSTALPVFMALATVNDGFREVLQKFAPKAPKGKTTVTGLDTALELAGEKLRRALETRLSGAVDRSPNVQVAMDHLTQHVVTETMRAHTAAENMLEKVRSGFAGANSKVVQVLQYAGEKARKKGLSLTQNKSKLDIALGRTLTLTAALVSEKSAAAVGESELARQDKTKGMWNWARELFGSDGIIGRVASQAKVYDMYKKVRSMVAQLRQQYREHIPAIIEEKFRFKAPDEREYDVLYRFMGRSDLASLIQASSGRTLTQILDLVADPKARDAEILRLQGELKAYHTGPNATLIEKKIDQLVAHMRGEGHGKNLLRNAYAISELLNETKDAGWKAPSDALITTIDQLTTLKYLARMEPAEHNIFARFNQDEKAAMEFMFSYLKGQREGELPKATDDRTKFNHFKGELPHETNNGHLVVIEDSEHAKYTLLGYQRLGAYKGSNIESRKGSFSYYFSPDGGVQTQFNQGLIQNVQGTAYGVHTSTGLSMAPTAGVITGMVEVEDLVKRMKYENVGSENLSPIFNEDGEVVAFERTLDPKMLENLKAPQHLARMIGHWRGRQAEEIQAGKINEEVIGYLHQMWSQDKGTMDAERYENLFASKDPVIKDAVSLMSKETRKLLAEKFGKGNFPVRRNLINQVAGYRQASIGDMWTGNTHMPKEFQDVVKKFFISMPGLGENAYRRLVWAERNWQAVTSTMRNNIVVRSMTVSAANIISGLYQLKARGVPMVAIARALPKKFAEIEYYTRAMAKRIRLEAELYADPVRSSNLKTEIQNIDDSMKRLSIWPLIANGEFSTIADVGNTSEFGNEHGTLVEQLEHAADQLPAAARNLVRQGYLARDTALFQALQKSVQYSDFVMKAIYYDHLLEHGKHILEETPGYREALDQHRKTYGADPRAEKLAREEMALGRITEEFNNYDLPTGRTRGYAESMGMAWFLNYKIRAAKIGLSMLRNNPLDVLLFGAMPHPFAGGIPVTDNIFARTFEGSMGNAFGPGMVTHPIAWNSWYNLFGN